MSKPDKLQLVQRSMDLLVPKLRASDKVSIVVYARNEGLALPATPGDKHERIQEAFWALSPGSGTHGSAGIKLAYSVARENFVADGTNRVILATDGDFNVGVTGDDELVALIKKEAESGVFLSVLGFGQGNVKHAKMEKLADHGNGVYSYIDSLKEAQKVLVAELSGTLCLLYTSPSPRDPE